MCCDASGKQMYDQQLRICVSCLHVLHTTVLIIAFLVDWEVQGVHARQAHTENGGHVR
jgi:hypothetical protein